MHTSHSYLRLVKSDAGCFLMKWQTRGQKRDVSGCQMPIPFTRGLTNMVLCNFMLRPCAIVKWQQPERSLFLSFAVTMLPTNRFLTALPKSTFCWLSNFAILFSRMVFWETQRNQWFAVLSPPVDQKCIWLDETCYTDPSCSKCAISYVTLSYIR